MTAIASAVHMTISRETLVEALERLLESALQPRRRRSPVEAAVANTRAYVELVLAVAFARLGADARADALHDLARDRLRSVADDPVHAYLIAAFSSRIAQAGANDPPARLFPSSLTPLRSALDLRARYTADRMREASRLLDLGPPDAADGLSRRTPDTPPPVELVELFEIADPTSRASRVEELLETGDPRLVRSCFDALLGLREEHAMTLVARVAQVPGAPHELCSRSLVAAAQFGWAELIDVPLQSLRDACARADGPRDLAGSLAHAIRALHRLGLRDEIADLIAPFAPQEGAPDRHTALLAGAMIAANDPRAPAQVARVRAALEGSMRLMARLELTRALVVACSFASVNTVLRAVEGALQHLPSITDSFGTNSHYCLSVVYFVDALAHGIVELDWLHLGTRYGPASR